MDLRRIRRSPARTPLIIMITVRPQSRIKRITAREVLAGKSAVFGAVGGADVVDLLRGDVGEVGEEDCGDDCAEEC